MHPVTQYFLSLRLSQSQDKINFRETWSKAHNGFTAFSKRSLHRQSLCPRRRCQLLFQLCPVCQRLPLLLAHLRRCRDRHIVHLVEHARQLGQERLSPGEKVRILPDFSQLGRHGRHHPPLGTARLHQVVAVDGELGRLPRLDDPVCKVVGVSRLTQVNTWLKSDFLTHLLQQAPIFMSHLESTQVLQASSQKIWLNLNKRSTLPVRVRVAAVLEELQDVLSADRGLGGPRHVDQH